MKLFSKGLLRIFTVSVASPSLWRRAPSIYYVKPSDRETTNKQDSTNSFYSQYLNGRKTFVGPCHSVDSSYSNVNVDGKPVQATLENDSNKIVFKLSALMPGRHYFTSVIKNGSGDHSFPFLGYFCFLPHDRSRLRQTNKNPLQDYKKGIEDR